MQSLLLWYKRLYGTFCSVTWPPKTTLRCSIVTYRESFIIWYQILYKGCKVDGQSSQVVLFKPWSQSIITSHVAILGNKKSKHLRKWWNTTKRIQHNDDKIKPWRHYYIYSRIQLKVIFGWHNITQLHSSKFKATVVEEYATTMLETFKTPRKIKILHP